MSAKPAHVPNGLRLSAGECDRFDIFWNHAEASRDWWRLESSLPELHAHMQREPRLVVLRHYFDPFGAQLASATLEAAGIPVFLRNENFANTAWTEIIAVGGVQVLVPEAFLAEAEAVLGQSTRVLPDDGPSPPCEETPPPSFSRFVSSCPACASCDLEFHLPLRRLAAVLSVVSLPLVPPVKRYRCRSCGHVFRREGPA